MGIRTWLGLKKKSRSAKNELPKPPFWHERSFSQIQQDRWVLSELNEKTGGFFVEVGAFDGQHLSNSYLLEKDFGWSGILAEPNPALSENIKRLRTSPLCTQPVDKLSGNSVSMRFVTGAPEYSSLSERAFSDAHASIRSMESVEVIQTTISLNDLLVEFGAPAHIDFLSLDTEGNELDILSSFSFDRYDIKLMCVEHNGTSADAALDELLIPLGYERVYREWSRFDAWYRKTN